MATQSSPSPIRRLQRPFFVFLFLAIIFSLNFALWSRLVFHGTVLPAFDLRLAETYAAHSPDHPITRGLMIVATSCGGIRANMLIALGGAWWMWKHHRRRFAFAWLAIALVGGVIELGLKESFGRQRPPIALRDAAVHQTNESYPSGHAMGSLVGYGMLGFVLLQSWKDWRRRLLVGGLLGMWIVVIGLSRIYLRAHWFSDVIGGWLLGLAYVNACLAIYVFRRPT